ncbi:sodium:solute symporter family transporter [Shigella flexneri]
MYTAFGGFGASVLNEPCRDGDADWNRFAVGVVHAAGGLSNAVVTLQTIDPKLVSPQGADDILSPTFMTSFWVLVCLA